MELLLMFFCGFVVGGAASALLVIVYSRRVLAQRVEAMQVDAAKAVADFMGSMPPSTFGQGS